VAQLTAEAGQRLDHLLFAEGGARIVVSVNPSQVADWEAFLADQHLRAQRLGTVAPVATGLRIEVEADLLIQVAVAELQRTWEQAIERRLEG
jgi:phosphoribosylformylglycinamidine synthase